MKKVYELLVKLSDAIFFVEKWLLLVAVVAAAVVALHRTCTLGFPRHITHHRRLCTARGCMIRSTTTCGPASRRRAAARPTRGATSNGRLRHQARRHQGYERSR